MKIYKLAQENLEQSNTNNSTILDPSVIAILKRIKDNINWKSTSNEWGKGRTESSIGKSFLGYSNFAKPGSPNSYRINISIPYMTYNYDNHYDIKYGENAIIDIYLNKKMSKTEDGSILIATYKPKSDRDEIMNILSQFGNFGVLRMPKEIELKKTKQIRLTKPKSKIRGIDAIILKIVVNPQDEGYITSYIIEYPEIGKIDQEKVIKSKNDDGSYMTFKQAEDIANNYASRAIENGYEDKNSYSYIPEGANKDNWNFDLNMPKNLAEYESINQEEKEETISKNKHHIKLSQDFQGYYTGTVPEYAANFLGSSAVDASQIQSMFGKANEAIDLVNRFDSSLLYNISFVFNFSKGGAYGVYLSSLDRAIKTVALKKKLEQKGYTVQNTANGLTALPKQGEEKSPQEIQNDIDTIYQDLESKGGTAIGINMSAVLNAARMDAADINSSDPNILEWITILHLGGTIVHEAIHAKGSTGEGPSEQGEQKFTQWALPIINEKYLQNLKSQGKEDEFTPLMTGTNKRHAKNNNVYKIAQEDWYTEEVAKNTDDPEILRKILEKGNDDWVSRKATLNPNCPPEVLAEVLRRGKNDNVSYYAIDNPNCPTESLAEILRRGKNDLIAWNAARNPKCPSEALAEVLTRGEDDSVSWYAFSNPNCPPKAKLDWMRATGRLTTYNPQKHKIDKPETKEDKDLKELEKLLANNKNWYKTAQMSYYIPQSFMESAIGSDLSGRFPNGAQNDSGLAPWSMISQLDQAVPIETRLSKQYMSKIPRDLDQENDIIEEQLRKYTRQDQKIDTKATISEMLSKGYDSDRGYTTLEGLLDEKRPKPLLVPLKKKASKDLIKTATLFGWMNNLSISDGSTIPGLGDRVMAWDDRDESFSAEESWIKSQPRYNPEYDIKGFYYRWIEPRFKPQLFDDMTRDYSNTHPAKRFASSIDNTDNEAKNIISILTTAKRKIESKDIKSTRFVITEDVMPIFDNIFSGDMFKINVYSFGTTNDGEDILAVWVSDKDTLESDIEQMEKHFQSKEISKNADEMVDSLLGISTQKQNAINEIIEETKDVCNSYGISDVYIIGSYPRDIATKTPSYLIENMDFAGGRGDQIFKVGSMVADKLGIRNVKVDHKNMTLSFSYADININFQGNYSSNELKNQLKSKNIEINPLNIDVYNRDFTINMMVYDLLNNELIDISGEAKNDMNNKIIKTFFDPEYVCRQNPLTILRAIKLKIRYGFEIDTELQKAMIKNSPLLFNGKYTNDRLIMARENVKKENKSIAEEMFNEFGIEKINEIGV